MRSIPLAMTWEMLQRGRWHLIAYFLGAQLIISIVFGALARAGVDFEDPSIVGVGASFLLTYMFLFSVGTLAYQGPPSRLYTYPIPSSTIVSGHLLVSMASVGFQVWLSIFLMNTFFQTHWPLWGPVPFARFRRPRGSPRNPYGHRWQSPSSLDFSGSGITFDVELELEVVVRQRFGHR